MSYVIIGTAGHIDHGKSTLIKRISGIDTDRLKEEKKRGITIELGFAYFDLPSGKRCGIIDVPGHEKFIKHMLAGAGGIDIVLMVIAADEGIMPQTREHIDILNLLGAENGIICLTKADLIDEETMLLIKAEIEDELKDSFLAGAPVIEIGMGSEEGIEKLKAEIDRLAAELDAPVGAGNARLPIDRVFSLTGFGTIVTGTLIEGQIKVGDKLNLYPKNLDARVRNIQVHSKDVKEAYQGQRVAVNIANLKVEDISRGDVLAPAGSMKVSYIVDANVSLLSHSGRSLHNWSRVRIYYGSNEVLARIVLLDREELKPGESAFVQFRLEEEIALKYGDRFVLRFYSPLQTIGGGTVLDPNASKHKRFKDEIIESLAKKSEADGALIVEDLLVKHSAELPDIAYLVEISGKDETQVTEYLEELMRDGRIVSLDSKTFVSSSFIDEKETEIFEYLIKFYQKESLKLGIARDAVRTKFFGKIKPRHFDELMAIMAAKGNIEDRGKIITTAGRKIEFDPLQRKSRDKIESVYKKAGFNPENLKELASKLSFNKRDYEVLEAMVEIEDLVRLNDAIYLHSDFFDKAVDIIKNEINQNGSIALAKLRDMTESSRKVCVAILDYLDAIGLTYRDGDVRKLK